MVRGQIDYSPAVLCSQFKMKENPDLLISKIEPLKSGLKIIHGFPYGDFVRVSVLIAVSHFIFEAKFQLTPRRARICEDSWLII